MIARAIKEALIITGVLMFIVVAGIWHWGGVIGIAITPGLFTYMMLAGAYVLYKIIQER